MEISERKLKEKEEIFFEEREEVKLNSHINNEPMLKDESQALVSFSSQEIAFQAMNAPSYETFIKMEEIRGQKLSKITEEDVKAIKEYKKANEKMAGMSNERLKAVNLNSDEVSNLSSIKDYIVHTVVDLSGSRAGQHREWENLVNQLNIGLFDQLGQAINEYKTSGKISDELINMTKDLEKEVNNLETRLNEYIDNRSVSRSIFNLFKGTIGSGKQRFQTAKALKIFLNNEVKPFIQAKISIFTKDGEYEVLEEKIKDYHLENKEKVEENNRKVIKKKAESLEEKNPDRLKVARNVEKFEKIKRMYDENQFSREGADLGKRIFELPVDLSKYYEGLDKNFSNTIGLYYNAVSFLNVYKNFERDDELNEMAGAIWDYNDEKSMARLSMTVNKAKWIRDNLEPFAKLYETLHNLEEENKTISKDDIIKEKGKLLKIVSNKKFIDKTNERLLRDYDNLSKVDAQGAYEAFRLDKDLPDLKLEVNREEISAIMYKNIDAYAYFDLPKGANFEDFKAAYKKKAIQLHPDKNKNRNASEQFQELGNIYIAVKKAFNQE